LSLSSLQRAISVSTVSCVYLAFSNISLLSRLCPLSCSSLMSL
jgi:hypothetical protein